MNFNKSFKYLFLQLHDIAVAVCCLALSLLLHQDFYIQQVLVSSNSGLLVWVVTLSYFLSSFLNGANRSIIRFFSLPAAKSHFRSTFFSFGLCLFFSFYFSILSRQNFSVLVTQAIFFLGLSLLNRLVYRHYHMRHTTSVKQSRRTLIIGAGQAASMLLRDIQAYKSDRINPVAILDDNINLKNRYLHGVKVVGICSNIEEVLVDRRIDLVIIAIPSLKNKKLISMVTNTCLDKKIRLRMLPGLSDLIDGRVTVNSLRQVSVEDLLGRKSVVFDKTTVPDLIQSRSILVTGGGGSIGSELSRQIAFYRPKELIILDHSEYNLYAIELDIKERFPHVKVIPALGSVVDERFVDNLIARHQPDLVLHAAAYKHVPMLENQILSAVENNVKGTWVVAKAALQHRVKQFILISTDKAVNPANIMGSTKRVAELVCQYYARQNETQFSIVRFGNVLNSVGSVIPRFQKQIESGGPVTVTDPDITRYFMMIPEAAQLILKAIQLGGSGEIYVLDMGDPIKIDDLAKNMIRLSGRQLGEDIEIKYTGLRPGEKLYEELFHDQENLRQTQIDSVFVAKARQLSWTEVGENLTKLVFAADKGDVEQAVNYLSHLVPESRSSILAGGHAEPELAHAQA